MLPPAPYATPDIKEKRASHKLAKIIPMTVQIPSVHLYCGRTFKKRTWSSAVSVYEITKSKLSEHGTGEHHGGWTRTQVRRRSTDLKPMWTYRRALNCCLLPTVQDTWWKECLHESQSELTFDDEEHSCYGLTSDRTLSIAIPLHASV